MSLREKIGLLTAKELERLGNSLSKNPEGGVYEISDSFIGAILKAVEECVPEEKKIQNNNTLLYTPPPKDGDVVTYKHINNDERQGFNNCRQQMLDNIRGGGDE